MAVRDSKTEWLRAQRYRTMTPQRRFEIAQELTQHGRWVALNMARKNSARPAREIEFEYWNRIYDKAFARRAIQAGHDWELEADSMQGQEVVAQLIRHLEQAQIPSDRRRLFFYFLGQTPHDSRRRLADPDRAESGSRTGKNFEPRFYR